MTGTAATATATLDETAPSRLFDRRPTRPRSTPARQRGRLHLRRCGTPARPTTTRSPAAAAALRDRQRHRHLGLQYVTNSTSRRFPTDLSPISVTLTDAAGNTGTAATATATFDATAPTGYTIAADEASMTRLPATAASFTFADAEVGDNLQLHRHQQRRRHAVHRHRHVTSADRK